jgi:hypothetical protein
MQLLKVTPPNRHDVGQVVDSAMDTGPDNAVTAEVRTRSHLSGKPGDPGFAKAKQDSSEPGPAHQAPVEPTQQLVVAIEFCEPVYNSATQWHSPLAQD